MASEGLSTLRRGIFGTRTHDVISEEKKSMGGRPTVWNKRGEGEGEDRYLVLDAGMKGLFGEVEVSLLVLVPLKDVPT